jgi:hypothetical protein
MSRLVHLLFEEYDKNAFAGFQPNPGFIIGNARALMWMAQLAYEAYPGGSPDIIKRVGGLWGFTDVASFERKNVALGRTYDTCGVVGERPDAIVLAVAGTDPGGWKTIVTDFTLRPGGDTHAGFQASADSIRDDVVRVRDASRTSHKPLFVTGHSLGAAVAAIAAFDQGADPAALYFFGMPRPGNAAFHDRYAPLAERTFRFVHGIDVVARVPPSSFGPATFRHVGKVLACASGSKFDRNGQFSSVSSDDPAFAQELVDAAIAPIGQIAHGHILSPPGPGPFGPFFVFIPQPIRDHLQDSYWKALTP